MPEYIEWKDQQINNELARAFREIVTAGWANLSDGNVEAPTGAFSLVHIDPSELGELTDAVFPYVGEPTVTIYPGSYLVEEDSDGNTTLIEYLTLDRALAAYNMKQREFALWGPTCPKCGNEGPHYIPGNSNLHVCSCGKTWDPTEDVETKREDFALYNGAKSSANHAFVERDATPDDEDDPEVAAEEDAEAREERLSEMMVQPGTYMQPHSRNDECESKGCVPLRPVTFSNYEEPDEKMYLVHDACGEAFDDLKIAAEHECEPRYDSGNMLPGYEWKIAPESEAM